jgi:hypothetical protein
MKYFDVSEGRKPLKIFLGLESLSLFLILVCFIFIFVSENQTQLLFTSFFVFFSLISSFFNFSQLLGNKSTVVFEKKFLFNLSISFSVFPCILFSCISVVVDLFKSLVDDSKEFYFILSPIVLILFISYIISLFLVVFFFGKAIRPLFFCSFFLYVNITLPVFHIIFEFFFISMYEYGYFDFSSFELLSKNDKNVSAFSVIIYILLLILFLSISSFSIYSSLKCSPILNIYYDVASFYDDFYKQKQNINLNTTSFLSNNSSKKGKTFHSSVYDLPNYTLETSLSSTPSPYSSSSSSGHGYFPSQFSNTYQNYFDPPSPSVVVNNNRESPSPLRLGRPLSDTLHSYHSDSSPSTLSISRTPKTPLQTSEGRKLKSMYSKILVKYSSDSSKNLDDYFEDSESDVEDIEISNINNKYENELYDSHIFTSPQFSYSSGISSISPSSQKNNIYFNLHIFFVIFSFVFNLAIIIIQTMFWDNKCFTLFLT